MVLLLVVKIQFFEQCLEQFQWISQFSRDDLLIFKPRGADELEFRLLLMNYIYQRGLLQQFQSRFINYSMSSDSDHSSSSPAREKQPKQHSERSRSRDKEHRRRSDQNPPQNRKAKIRIPQLTSNLLSFKVFLQHQVERINIEQAQRAYDKYKKDWEQKQHQVFLNSCRDDAWFRQKYDPEFLDAIQMEKREKVKRNFSQFIANFQKNVYQNIDLSIKQTATLGYSLPSDRYEDEEDTFNSLIASQTVDIGLNQSIDITQEPYFGFDPDVRTLFAKNVSKKISRFDIYEIARQLKGFKNITFSQPVKKNDFSRYCWVQFNDQESFLEADLAMSALIIKDQKINFTKSISKMKKAKVLKNYPITRISVDLQSAQAMAKKLDHQYGISEANPVYEAVFDSQKKKFDTILLYLRRVHAYDYFTTASFENQRLMSLKMGSIFLRIEANYTEMEGVQTVFKKIKESTDAKLALQTVTPDYIGNLRMQIEKYIRQTQKLGKDQLKQVWKCSLCDKRFKTCEFLAKHIIVKHPEIKDKKVKYMMDQAYIKDPNKITPSTFRDEREQFRGRKPYNPNFRRGNGRRQNYRDLDEPEGQKTTKTINKPMINYLDI